VPAFAARGSAAEGAERLERSKRDIARRYEAQALSIKIHAFLFVAGTAGFLFLNSISTPFPWAFFPIAGWVVGLAGHFTAFMNRRRELAQVSRVAECVKEALGVIRAHQRCVGAWKQHLSAFITANAYVWGINAVTSMAFPWAAFPTGAWTVGLVCHAMGNAAKRRRLEKRFAELGGDPSLLRSGGPIKAAKPAAGPFTMKARAIAEAMSARYRAEKSMRSHWSEVAPLLGTAIAQIEELEAKRLEFDRITASITDEGLEAELAELREKRDRASAERVRKEYDRSIAQGESRLKAHEDLRQRGEILDLRLQSAVNLIKQLEIDGARIATLDGYEEPASIALIRSKTAENQAFLEDYRDSLDRIAEGADPLAERIERLGTGA